MAHADDLLISDYLRWRAEALLGKRPAAVGEPVQERLQQIDLARRCGVSKGWVSQWLGGSMAGPKVQRGMRAILGVSGDELEEAARRWGEQRPPLPPQESRVEYDPAYPELAKAIRAARELEVDEAAVQRVYGDRNKGGDQPALDWLDEMRSEARRLRRGAPSGPRVDESSTELPPPPPRLGKKK